MTYQAATRTLAKQLVTLRGQKDQLYTARARISGVGHAASSAATQASLAGVMGNVAGVMKNVNDAVSTEEMAKVMQQFAVENEKMGMSEEMMDDALIDAVRVLADGEALFLSAMPFRGFQNAAVSSSSLRGTVFRRIALLLTLLFTYTPHPNFVVSRLPALSTLEEERN